MNLLKGMLCCNEECLKPYSVLACSICLAAFYCSKECQRKDWEEHKKECKNPTHRYTNEEHKFGICNPKQELEHEICWNPVETMHLRQYHKNWVMKLLNEKGAFISDPDSGELEFLAEYAPAYLPTLRIVRFNSNPFWNCLFSFTIKNILITTRMLMKLDTLLVTFIDFLYTIQPERLSILLIGLSEWSFLVNKFSVYIGVVSIMREGTSFQCETDVTRTIQFNEIRLNNHLNECLFLLWTAYYLNPDSPFYHEKIPLEILNLIQSYFPFDKIAAEEVIKCRNYKEMPPVDFRITLSDSSDSLKYPSIPSKRQIRRNKKWDWHSIKF